ncbi:DUF1772 domain-containing protein [Chelatococcus daeguensis]|uniref:DUF1772 domain-containing protein n=1 Tax=Chelatococcus daeguensis TaxID=444444 RepID=A0AAC9JSI4_9HYPH|nr:DUF1772 domain-containing protein [Chelatococcus daeguensis]APF37721.1 DUF1772 domain-containing protein [Chelatococcus daeguensis]
MRYPTAHDVVFFVAMLATALALGPAMAHLLELPNKIGLPAADYFVVQQAYRGWSLLGFLILVELLSMAALAVMARREPRVLWPVLVAIASVIGAQAVFWTWTYPANAATRNWTFVPENWEILRRQWEFSHAAGAFLQVLAMAALILAVLRRSRA